MMEEVWDLDDDEEEKSGEDKWLCIPMPVQSGGFDLDVTQCFAFNIIFQ